MKGLLIIIIAGSQVSCLVGDKKAMIQEVLNEKTYTIERKFSGCFGGATETFKVNNSQIATYILVNDFQPNGPVEETQKISWSKKKEILLKQIFETGIISDRKNGLCTTISKYKLKGATRTVEFVDSDCTLSEKFEALLR